MKFVIISDTHRYIKNAVNVLCSSEGVIYTELSRWIKKFCLMSDIMELSLKVLSGKAEKDELSSMMEAYNESATVLTGFCFREYIESVLYND